MVPGSGVRQRQRRGPELELTELRYPARSLLVIGGPPGAGKSTLAERAVCGAAVLDPDAVRGAIPEGLFEHLLREWAALRRALAAGEPLPEEPASVTVLTRPEAAAVDRIVLGGGRGDAMR